MRTRIFLLVTAMVVALGGTSAFAQTADDGRDNTAFAATVSDESLDAALESETLYIRYVVCSLHEGVEDFCDGALDDFEPETFDAWTAEIEVTPNGDGEYNHGSFVSAFAQGYDGPGKGCILRFIAQSDWGKPGADPTADPLIEATTYCAAGDERTSDDTDTESAGKGKPAWAGSKSEGKAGGPPPWAGKPGGRNG